MNRSRAKGTAAETAVVGAARLHGFRHARRNALAGSKDVGDVWLCPDVTVSVKATRAFDLAGAVDDLADQVANEGARTGVVVLKRPRKGSPAEWYAVLSFGAWMDLVEQAGYQ